MTVQQQPDYSSLKPLAAVIEKAIQSAPVRLGTEDWASVLGAQVLAHVAAYMGRTLGPAPAVLAEKQAELNDEDLDEDGCWEWTGTRDRDGYGLKTVDGRQWRVHRLSYMESTGEDPGQLHVLHSCDNPPCYRPSHLRLGTNADNVRDKVERGRARNQYTDTNACIYGHLFTPGNTYVNPASGNRQCRTCRRLNNALDKKLAKAPKEDRKILREIFRERMRQDFVFGWQNHPDGTGGIEARRIAEDARRNCQAAAERGTVTWLLISDEEHCEALAESDPVKLRAELVQDAAVKVAWIAAIDRRTAAPVV